MREREEWCECFCIRKKDVLLYKWLQLAKDELSTDMITKDMMTDRLDDVDAVRQRKKLAVIGDKEREGSVMVLLVGIVLQDE